MKHLFKILFFTLIVCLALNTGSFTNAQHQQSDPDEDWRKYEPKPPKEPPQVIFEKGCRVETIAGTGQKGLKDGPALSALFYKSRQAANRGRAVRPGAT